MFLLFAIQALTWQHATLLSIEAPQSNQGKWETFLLSGQSQRSEVKLRACSSLESRSQRWIKGGTTGSARYKYTVRAGQKGLYDHQGREYKQGIFLRRAHQIYQQGVSASAATDTAINCGLKYTGKSHIYLSESHTFRHASWYVRHNVPTSEVRIWGLTSQSCVADYVGLQEEQPQAAPLVYLQETTAVLCFLYFMWLQIPK